MYTGCQSFPSLPVFHTHPFTAALTQPSFMLPLVFPACQCPHPLQPLFLLLSCLALTLTLGTTHSLYVHNSPSELAHEHTLLRLRDAVSLHASPSCTFRVPVTTPICTPAHPHAERAIHSMPVPQLIAAKDGVVLGMSSQLLTPPQSIPTSFLHSPCRDNCHHCLHIREHTHMYPHQKWSASSACYACTPPTVRCVSVQGVSCTLSGLSGLLSPTLIAIIHSVLEMPVPSPQLTSIFMCVCVREREFHPCDCCLAYEQMCGVSPVPTYTQSPVAMGTFPLKSLAPYPQAFPHCLSVTRKHAPTRFLAPPCLQCLGPLALGCVGGFGGWEELT